MLRCHTRVAAVACALLVAACAQGPTMTEPASDAIADEGPVRILALGDSYTIGESVATNRRWPVLLVRRLRDSGLEVARPTIVARTGWTTDELSAALDKREFEPPYHLVSLLIGVNDQYRGREAGDFAAGFTSLLERAIELAGDRPERVVVASIPDWGATPFARKDERSRERIATEIDEYNRVKRRIAGEHGVRHVDVTDISRRVPEDITLVANDGLHPSGRQYELWVERILPEVKRALSMER